MTEISFLIEESPEGGYVAWALSASIYTEADTLDELQVMIKDAVACHFADNECPQHIRLHMMTDGISAGQGCHPNVNKNEG